MVGATADQSKNSLHRWESYLAGAGIIFVIALIAEVILAWTPDATQTAAAMTAGYLKHRNEALLAGYLTFVISAAFLFFLSSLWPTLRRGSSGAFSLAALASGVTGVILLTQEAR